MAEVKLGMDMVVERRGDAGAGRRALVLWLTPPLYEPELAGLRLDQRHLLIGGTADRSWDPAAAAAGGAELMEITSADHRLELDDVPGSITVLADIQRRQEEFLTGLDC